MRKSLLSLCLVRSIATLSDQIARDFRDLGPRAGTPDPNTPPRAAVS